MFPSNHDNHRFSAVQVYYKFLKAIYAFCVNAFQQTLFLNLRLYPTNYVLSFAFLFAKYVPL